MSNSDYADSPAFGSNKVAVADDEAIAPADYREPKQMTRMEEPPSPMELLLQKTKLRLVNSRVDSGMLISYKNSRMVKSLLK